MCGYVEGSSKELESVVEGGRQTLHIKNLDIYVVAQLL